MARPHQSESQKEAFQQRVIETSKEIILRDGLRAFSIRKVAKAMACGPSTLYHYFENKNAILYLVWRSVTDKTDARAKAHVERDVTPAERIEYIVDGSLEYASQNPIEYDLIYSLEPIVHPVDSEPFSTGYQVLLNAVIDLLAASGKDKNLAPLFAQSFWVAIHGAIRLHQDVKPFPLLPAEDLSRNLIQSLIHKISS